MRKFNQDLLDALIRHQVFLMRFSAHIRVVTIEQLNAQERELASLIREGTRNLSIADTARVRRLENSIRNLRMRVWDSISALWTEKVKELSAKEVRFLERTLKAVSPISLDIKIPSVRALTTPYEGRNLAQWLRDVREADIKRITTTLRAGLVQQETPTVIAQRIVGTSTTRGLSGVTQTTRRNVQGITRTLVTGASNHVKRELFVENEELFGEELYVAVLDGRTSAICRSLGGKVFPVGEGPMPPLHFNCRSTRVPIFSARAVARNPDALKPRVRKEFLAEFATARGIRAPTSRDGLPRNMRNSYDQFVRTKVRKAAMEISREFNYDSWLRTQSTTFQDMTLGKTRAALFRKGNLRLDRFVNRNGDELTLQDLARLETEAFRKAGIDPEAYL